MGLMVVMSGVNVVVNMQGDVVEYTAPQEEVLIQTVLAKEESTEWTRERIEQEVRSVFGEYGDYAVTIAVCESNLRADAINHNTNGTIDVGVFQLNSVHDKALDELGLDKFNPEDNIQFAKVLFDESLRRHGYGWVPWVCDRIV